MIPGAATLADITSADWSLMLDATASVLGLPTGIGNVVEGLDDIEQCLAIILTTPPGSDPLRPIFACDLFQFIDQPISIALPAIVAAVFDAIELWEPRIVAENVSAQPGAVGQLLVSVTWRVNLPGSVPQTTTVTIGALAEAISA